MYTCRKILLGSQRLCLLLALLISVGLSPALAQSEIEAQLLSTGGSSHINPSAEIHFSIGEPLVDEYGDIHQGFIQVTNQLITTSTQLVRDQKSGIEVFPNPSPKTITIRTTEAQPASGVRMFDLKGNFLLKDQQKFRVRTIDLSGLPSASYLLVVDQSTGPVSFKIIKP